MTTPLGTLYALQAVLDLGTFALQLSGHREEVAEMTWRIVLAHNPPPAILDKVVQDGPAPESPAFALSLLKVIVDEALQRERRHPRAERYYQDIF